MKQIETMIDWIDKMRTKLPSIDNKVKEKLAEKIS